MYRKFVIVKKLASLVTSNEGMMIYLVEVEGEKNADQGQSQLSQPEVVGPLPISGPRWLVTLSNINVVFDIMY